MSPHSVLNSQNTGNDQRRTFRSNASVAICTFRRPALLEACLESVLQQSNPFGSIEVIVIDNCVSASAKPVVSRAEAAFAGQGVPLRHVVEENSGVAFARNRALAEAEHPIICFLDDDERALPNWLANLLAPFAEHGSAVDIVAGEVEPDFGDFARPEWLEDRFLPLFSCQLGWDTKPRFLHKNEWLIEGNCAFRTSLFETHRFDTNLGRKGDTLFSSEGMIFTILRNQGAAGFFSPNARASHLIHPDRLNKKWLMKRMMFQGISDFISHRPFNCTINLEDVKVSPKSFRSINVDGLAGAELEAVSMLYYQFGYGMASNMY